MASLFELIHDQPRITLISLEMAVGSACMVQSIDLSGVTGEIAVTLLVIRVSPVLPGESMGCTRCVLTTAVSRFRAGIGVRR